MKQLGLFNRYPASPGYKAPGTSKAAAHLMKRSASRLSDACLKALAERPMTPDETAAELKQSVLAIRPRFSELYKQGKISPTGETRPNASGRLADVWKVNN